MSEQNLPAPKHPLVLSILPTRAEIESMAAWGSGRPAGPVASERDTDAAIHRAIADYRARQTSGKVGKTYTVEEVRKMFRLPPR